MEVAIEKTLLGKTIIIYSKFKKLVAYICTITQVLQLKPHRDPLKLHSTKA
jgi:hypothetical protein